MPSADLSMPLERFEETSREIRPGGPLRINQEEIRGTFGAPWHVAWIEPARFVARNMEEGAEAWFAKIHYQGTPA
jgi:hypothetical protein